MFKYLNPLACSAGILMGGAVAANAALIDFTADDSLSGSFRGINYTVTGSPVQPNLTQEFDGDAADVAAPLALENDGIGIDDDEVAFSEMVTVTFDRDIVLTGVHFLDLFESPVGGEEEVAEVTSGAITGELTFDALQPYSPDGTGYAQGDFVDPLVGSVFTFTAAPTNDNQGDPDYALAGLEVAPIPLPAGALLLLTGVGALAAGRRWKKA